MRNFTPALIVVFALALPLLYGGAYLWRGTWNDFSLSRGLTRNYPTALEAAIFAPAAKLESWVRGRVVETRAPGDYRVPASQL